MAALGHKRRPLKLEWQPNVSKQTRSRDGAPVRWRYSEILLRPKPRTGSRKDPKFPAGREFLRIPLDPVLPKSWLTGFSALSWQIAESPSVPGAGNLCCRRSELCHTEGTFALRA